MTRAMDMLDGGPSEVASLEDVSPGTAPGQGLAIAPAPGLSQATGTIEESGKFPLPENGVRIIVVISPQVDLTGNSSGSSNSLTICDVATELAREESARAFVALLATEQEKQAKRAKLGGKKKASEFDNVSLYAPEGVGWGMDHTFGGDMKLALAFQTRGGVWVGEAALDRLDRRMVVVMPSMRAGSRQVTFMDTLCDAP